LPRAINHNINGVYVRSEISAQPASLGTPKTLRSTLNRQLTHHSSSDFGSVRSICPLRLAEVSDDFTLSPGADRTLAVKRRQDTIGAQDFDSTL